MKINEILTENESQELLKALPIIDLEKYYSEDEWENLIDEAQDKAVELLQANTANAVMIDDIVWKISEYEY